MSDAESLEPAPLLAGLRCWVFDLDGTLTFPVHDFDAIRRELGIVEGRPILEDLAQRPPEEARELHRRLQVLEAELARTVRARPGCRELLATLAGQGRRLGILTRNSRSNALASLERIGVADLFAPEDVLGREQARPKPDPDGILRLLGRWQAEPGEAVMVGDFSMDLEAGRRAGVHTIHLDPDGTCPWPELADLHVRGLEELIPPADGFS
jgi:HAD superfamily hydrolase (TIGR01509 family)